jgi:hypothetical protein
MLQKFWYSVFLPQFSHLNEAEASIADYRGPWIPLFVSFIIFHAGMGRPEASIADYRGTWIPLFVSFAWWLVALKVVIYDTVLVMPWQYTICLTQCMRVFFTMKEELYYIIAGYINTS